MQSPIFQKEADIMNYREAREYIASRKALGIRPGLERMAELAERLGEPQDKIKIIHVAGTNGKGSVCAMLSSYIVKKGLRVGAYTSPYVSHFNEQIRLDNCNITDEQFAALISEIKPHADIMDSEGSAPTEYEIMTAAAFLFFYRHNVDYAIIEVGLGGLEDATNIIKAPALSVITSISLDHTNILGDTLEKIAAQKAGIIKSGCPVVISPFQEDGVIEVLFEKATECGSEFIMSRTQVTEFSLSLHGTEFKFGSRTCRTSLIGAHQAENAVTAVAAIDFLFPEDSSGDMEFECVHPARFEIISEEPPVILDGAHNADGAKALRDTLDMLLDDVPMVGVMGMLADKNYKTAVRLLAPLFKKIYTVTPDNPRALTAEKLSECIAPFTEAESCGNVQEAVEKARNSGLPLVVFGSLYLAEEARKHLITGD